MLDCRFLCCCVHVCRSLVAAFVVHTTSMRYVGLCVSARLTECFHKMLVFEHEKDNEDDDDAKNEIVNQKIAHCIVAFTTIKFTKG